jgi:hypothetical protein
MIWTVRTGRQTRIFSGSLGYGREMIYSLRAKMESPRLPVIWYFDEYGVSFPVLFGVLNRLTVCISAPNNFGFIAGKSEPTIGFSIA